MSTLEKIKEKCEKYSGSEYVYKKCNNELDGDKIRRWLVVLKKMKDTRTNEDRKDVKNKSFAKFRADKLEVVNIINVFHPNKTTSMIINIYENPSTTKKTQYKIGETVHADDYITNIDAICAGGIHYFKTIEPAFFYDGVPKTYTGPGSEWSDDGENLVDRMYFEGISTGLKTFWYDDENIHSQGMILNGKKIGQWTTWYRKGNIAEDGYYLNDKKTGSWTMWGPYCNLVAQGNFKHSKKTEKWTYWYNNNEHAIFATGKYSNDEKNGEWIYRYENGDLKKRGKYLNGIEYGIWTYWDKDRKMTIGKFSSKRKKPEQESKQ